MRMLRISSAHSAHGSVMITDGMSFTASSARNSPLHRKISKRYKSSFSAVYSSSPLAAYPASSSHKTNATHKTSPLSRKKHSTALNIWFKENHSLQSHSAPRQTSCSKYTFYETTVSARTVARPKHMSPSTLTFSSTSFWTSIRRPWTLQY